MENEAECITIVLLEMGLSLFGIVLNLLIITTLRQDGSLPASTLNCLLLNLCFSNLIISFFVKPISAIYIGYSISTGQWHISLVFCTVYTVVYQTTWSIFPLTLLALSWFKIIYQCRRVCQCSGKELSPCCHKWLSSMSTSSFSYTEEDEEEERSSVIKRHHPHSTDYLMSEYSVVKSSDEEEDLRRSEGEEGEDGKRRSRRKVKRTVDDGLPVRQKILVAVIWLSSLFFGIMTCFPEKVFGLQTAFQIRKDQLKSSLPSEFNNTSSLKEEELLAVCAVKTGLNDLLDYISITLTFILPIILGPCLVTLVQGFLTLFHHFFCSSTSPYQERRSRMLKRILPSFNLSSQPSWGLVYSFTGVFLTTYPLHLYFSEVYVRDPLIFVIIKYCLGSSFILMIPMVILYWEKDIRFGLGVVVGGTLVCKNQKEESSGVIIAPNN